MRQILLTFTLLLLFSVNNFAQELSNLAAIPSFDTTACKLEAMKNGVLASEMAGYMRFKKAMYYAQYANPSFSTAKIKEVNQTMSISSSPCDNMDFSAQNFSSWTADTGSIDYFSSVATYAPGFSNAGLNASVLNPFARHTIFNIQPVSKTLPVAAPYTGYDTRITNMGFVDKVMPLDSDITLLAPGTSVSVRLGNALAGGQTEKLRKTFYIDASSEAFLYSYAAVLEDPGHSPAQQPRFTIRLLDINDSLLPGACSIYDVYAGKDSSYIGLTDTVCDNISYPGTCGPTKYDYKNWATVGVDLSPYLGQTITVEFTTRDCALGGHFGYAYINAMCSTFEVTSKFCPQQEYDTLVAPPGYVTYVWKDPNGNIIGNQREVVLLNPKLDDVYTVSLTSVTGCNSLLKSKITLNPPAIVPGYLLEQNVFSPNGDGKNDVFKTSQFKYVYVFHIEIFNRWGLKVFESSDATKEWDGKINGAEADAGVYYWMARYQSTCDPTHKDIPSKGFIHLLR